MALSDRLAQELPFLRRYARALGGSQAAGDAQVARLLERAIADPAVKVALAGGRVALYRAFTQLYGAGETGAEAGGAANARLQRVTPRRRQALLLTTLEDFSPGQAADILETGEAEIAALVEAAIAEIDREAATDVLIIEDEPLIALQLEELVRDLGHRVAGTAATRSQAQQAIASGVPGLVLADIQLADGSSGLDAVDDILAIARVPVVFITAYPERLLTGCRSEPAYLVTKPFDEATVRAAISQALFFHAPAQAE